MPLILFLIIKVIHLSLKRCATAVQGEHMMVITMPSIPQNAQFQLIKIQLCSDYFIF
jgi:hypothetical protein